LTDIFISYSSRDRAVAERVRDALQEAGYVVFWDQSTPPGQDWDTWIRDRLTGARLVVTLWTKASVASPNVRHESIIAREAGKLLPVMVDDLKPTDFPMGLFLVQALSIGRTPRQFAAAKDKFLDEVRARIGGGHGGGDAAPRPPGEKKRRLPLLIGSGVGALLVAVALVLAWPRLMSFIDPDAPPVSEQRIQASVAGERLARERVARSAETTLSGDQELIGTSWAWAAGQLLAGAPQESRALADPYFSYLARVERPECGCFLIYDTQHSIGNAWVILAAARMGRPAPPRLLDTILNSQSPEGWWPISFSAQRTGSNAALHATAILTVALAEARRAGVVPAAQRPRVDAALRRAVNWLNRGPPEGAKWTDYPNDDRRTENIVFSAMAAVASHLAGGPQDNQAAQAFVRSFTALPGATDTFPSGAYVELTNGERFFDTYRHPASPWTGAAAVMAYRQASPADKRRLRPLIASWLDVDLSDENLLRQDWITAETLFLRSLAFREIASEPAARN
jgi:hypothetical protein